MRNKSRKILRKGVSDLVVILALVAIAIPVALALQGWLGSQASKMSSYTATPQVNGVLVSKSVSSTGQVFIIRVKNTGSYNYSLASIIAKAILANGSIIQATASTASNLNVLQPGTTTTLSVVVPTKATVKTIVLTLENMNTGKEETLNVNVA